MTQSHPNTHTDVYTRITNQIIQAIEAGAGDWKMPWHSDGDSLMRPVNALSRKPYRGVNVLALWCAAQEQGYSSDRWATYKQWQESGAQVRKGEKSTQVVFWKINDSSNGEETDADEQGATRRPILARGYAVFNAAQVDSDPNPAPITAIKATPEIERIESAEQFFAALNADIRHGGARAFYRPSSDHIQMPPFEVFRDAVSYYSVLSHETTHWTGAKTRLDRDLKNRFGTAAYAAEELIAELGAAFLCADLGLSNEPRPDHAAYVANWLQVLREDARAIFTAASRAQQAIDFAHSQQPEPGAPQPDFPPDPEEESAPMEGTATAPPKRSAAPRLAL